MNAHLLINKPYYLFRPSQLLRRLIRLLRQRRAVGEWEQAILPWGHRIRYRPAEMIGSSIARTGLYDLCVSETLYRLVGPADLAVDAGANIGHMTSLMADRVGLAGKVIAIEPHPELFAELENNVRHWRDYRGVG